MRTIAYGKVLRRGGFVGLKKNIRHFTVPGHWARTFEQRQFYYDQRSIIPQLALHKVYTQRTFRYLYERTMKFDPARDDVYSIVMKNQRRLDAALYLTLKFGNMKEVRQAIKHGHVFLNGKKPKQYNIMLNNGDKIDLFPLSKEINFPKAQLGTEKRASLVAQFNARTLEKKVEITLEKLEKYTRGQGERGNRYDAWARLLRARLATQWTLLQNYAGQIMREGEEGSYVFSEFKSVGEMYNQLEEEKMQKRLFSAHYRAIQAVTQNDTRIYSTPGPLEGVEKFAGIQTDSGRISSLASSEKVDIGQLVGDSLRRFKPGIHSSPLGPARAAKFEDSEHLFLNLVPNRRISSWHFFPSIYSELCWPQWPRGFSNPNESQWTRKLGHCHYPQPSDACCGERSSRGEGAIHSELCSTVVSDPARISCWVTHAHLGQVAINFQVPKRRYATYQFAGKSIPVNLSVRPITPKILMRLNDIGLSRKGMQDTKGPLDAQHYIRAWSLSNTGKQSLAGAPTPMSGALGVGVSDGQDVDVDVHGEDLWKGINLSPVGRKAVSIHGCLKNRLIVAGNRDEAEKRLSAVHKRLKFAQELELESLRKKSMTSGRSRKREMVLSEDSIVAFSSKEDLPKVHTQNYLKNPWAEIQTAIGNVRPLLTTLSHQRHRKKYVVPGVVNRERQITKALGLILASAEGGSRIRKEQPDVGNEYRDNSGSQVQNIAAAFSRAANIEDNLIQNYLHNLTRQLKQAPPGGNKSAGKGGNIPRSTRMYYRHYEDYVPLMKKQVIADLYFGELFAKKKFVAPRDKRVIPLHKKRFNGFWVQNRISRPGHSEL